MYLTLENRLIGPPRLTQVRVTNDTCSVPPIFRNHFRNCYAYFDMWHEDKLSFSYKNSSAWQYQYDNVQNDGADNIRGHFGLYPTNSFTQVLSLKDELNKAIIRKLFDGNWIDRRTRAIIVEFSLYNANLDMFCFAQWVSFGVIHLC